MKARGILWSMLSFQCMKENYSEGEALVTSKVEKRQTRGKSCGLKVWSLKFSVVPSQSCSKANLEPRFQSWFVNIGSCQRWQRLGTSHFSLLRENLVEGTEIRGCVIRLVKFQEISAEIQFKFHGLKSKCFEKHVAHCETFLVPPFHSLLLGLAESRFHMKAKHILLYVHVLKFWKRVPMLWQSKSWKK